MKREVGKTFKTGNKIDSSFFHEIIITCDDVVGLGKSLCFFVPHVTIEAVRKIRVLKAMPK